jgi:hypothetical protein
MTNKTYLIIKKILLEYIKYLYATDVVILYKTFIHSFIHIIYFGKKHISNAEHYHISSFIYCSF